jgi:hypothetical protein
MNIRFGLFFLLISSSLSAEQLDVMLHSVAQDIVAVVAGTNGKVLAQSGSRVYLDLGKAHGLNEGESIEISAMGDDVIIDPDTGDVLGGFEMDTHEVVIETSQTTHSIAIAPTGVIFNEGDSVRRNLTSKTVLLLPLKPLNQTIGEDLKRSVQMGLTVELSKSGQVKIVERDKLDSAIKELELQNSGLVGQKAVGKLGQFVGADIIAITKMALFPRHVTLFLHLVSVESGEIIASFQRTTTKDDNLYRNLGQKPPVDLPYHGTTTYEVKL